MAVSFGNDFKRFFIRGLAAVLPTLLTVAIIVWFVTEVQNLVGHYINALVVWLYGQALVIVEYRGNHRDAIAGFSAIWDKWFWWVGFVVALIAVYVFGRFVGSFVGRVIWRVLEKAFFRLPVVRQIYPYVKQVTDFLFSERKMEFSRVVAVEYPRKGIWSIGLVTGPSFSTLDTALGGEMLTVFIPATPIPMNGFAMIVRRSEVIDLPITIDDAIRFVVSGGVIIPLNQRPAEHEVQQAIRGHLSSPRKET